MIAQIFAWAGEQPDKPALEHNGEVWSYADFTAAIERARAHYAAAGLSGEGIVLVGIMAYLSYHRWFSGGGATQIEVTGLYWHFIDIVWVFLYPMLYLINVHI